jgi:hypothetical protein
VTLRQKQSLFAQLFGTLIARIYEQGYECTLDWVYRPPEIAAYYADLGIGIRSSLHTVKLAADVNLFRGGVWLRTSEEHRPFGEWWEMQHPLCRWGGRFGDGNHYSLEHDGRK